MSTLQSRAVPGRRVLSRAVLVVVCLLAAGCGSRMHEQPPSGGAVRQVFFDAQDLATPDHRAVLTRTDQVAAYLRWLSSRPAPAPPSQGLAAALRQYRFDGTVLVVVARTVGCDSVGRVGLSHRGSDLSLVTYDVRHHPECFRANHLVAAFELLASEVPPGTTVDGAPPRTSWP